MSRPSKAGRTTRSGRRIETVHKLIRQRREAALKRNAKDGVPVRVVSQAVIDVLDATEVFGRRVVELSDAMDSSYQN